MRTVEHDETVADHARDHARHDDDDPVEDREAAELLDAESARDEHLQHEADARLRSLRQDGADCAASHVDTPVFTI